MTDLKNILHGSLVVVGIGNPLRGDDGFGPSLVRELQGLPFTCIDAGTAPESHVGAIVRTNPETVIIADAVSLDEKPGSWKIIEPGDIARTGFSTHDLSPSLFLEYLGSQTNATIWLLAVQPRTLCFGSELSPAVKNSLEEIVRVFKETYHA